MTFFGLSPSDAWRLTLREYHFLSKAHDQLSRRDHFRFALVCSVVANANRQKGKPFRPEDFMPRERAKKQSWQEQLQVLQQFVALYGNAEGGET